MENEYELFKRDEITRSLGVLPEKKIAEFQKQAEESAKKKHGSGIGLKTMTSVELRKLVAEKIGLPSFDEWKKMVEDKRRGES